MVLLGAAAADAESDRYAGRRTFMRGAPSCSTEPGAARLERGADGGVRGEFDMAGGPVSFFGTVGASGDLLGSQRAAADVEFTRVEGKFSGGTFTGITQSKSCRYRLELKRE